MLEGTLGWFVWCVHLHPKVSGSGRGKGMLWVLHQSSSCFPWACPQPVLDPELGFGLQAAPWVIASSCHGEVPLSALGVILLGCSMLPMSITVPWFLNSYGGSGAEEDVSN